MSNSNEKGILTQLVEEAQKTNALLATLVGLQAGHVTLTAADVSLEHLDEFAEVAVTAVERASKLIEDNPFGEGIALGG